MDEADAALLRVDRLTVRRNGVAVVNDLALRVPASGVLALVGGNGMGKTSALEGIMGLTRSDRGACVVVDGVPVSGWKTADIVRAGLTLVPEGRQLFPSLTVIDNIVLGFHTKKWICRRPLSELESVFELFPELQARRNTKAGALSGGQQQMVAIARALMTRPKALLLDEPFLGLSPGAVERVCTTIDRIASSEVAILVAEEDFLISQYVQCQCAVLDHGKIESLASSDIALLASVGTKNERQEKWRT